MRGSDERTGSLFSYVDLEARVRADHPLRTIREIANAALHDLSRAFDELYTDFGRPSIAPEKLLRAMLLQAFYGIRSERQLMERLEFDLLFRWFVGLGVDDPVWDHSVFSKNRDRLLEGEIAAKFLAAVLAQPKVKRLLSSDHFSVDGTLIEAWASIKSFRKKDGSDNDREGGGRNAERNFHKEKRSNETHQSTTDPEARLYRKGDGQPAKLCYMGHALIENRNGLVVGGSISQATGTAERETALALIDGVIAKGGSPSVPIRATMSRSSCMIYDIDGSRRTSQSTDTSARPARLARPRSINGPPVISATRLVSAVANGSKKCSAGSRAPRVWPR